MRPQTPGLGAETNGQYTIPTGSYSLTDTMTGTTNTLARGNLDAAGEASLTTTALTPGVHTLTWSYGGDTNFAPSTSSPYTVTVTGSTVATKLITSSSITRLNGSYVVEVRVSNTGSAAVQGISVTAVTLGSTAGAPVPQNIGTLTAGASATVQVTVPASAGASGSRVLAKIVGIYNGGGFGSTTRSVLP